MGNKLFGVNISGLIKDNIGPGVLAATLRVVTEGSRGANIDDGRTTTETDYPCRGFIDTQAQSDINGTLVDDGTKTIILIGDTINGGNTAPTTGDRIIIESTEYNIEMIDRDPAAATYTCVCRPH